MLTSFLTDYVRYVLKGGKQFYTWMGVLSAFILAMLYVFYLQNTDGLIVTGMTSQISDGLYLANLVFLVGVAAGAVFGTAARLPAAAVLDGRVRPGHEDRIVAIRTASFPTTWFSASICSHWGWTSPVFA